MERVNQLNSAIVHPSRSCDPWLSAANSPRPSQRFTALPPRSKAMRVARLRSRRDASRAARTGAATGGTRCGVGHHLAALAVRGGLLPRYMVLELVEQEIVAP